MTTSASANAHQPRPASGLIGRRTLVKGGAWAVPVVVASAHAPALAASCVMTTFNATIPTTTTASAGRSTFVVPAGVTRIQFEVVGGAGAGQSANRSGGAGARVTGELAVSPGMNLSLVVGQGGDRIATSAGTGGQGFGNGGNPGDVPTAANQAFFGGAGGGGSAILIGVVPVVVAGGGGGAGSGINPTSQASSYTIRPTGAPGGADAVDGVINWPTTPPIFARAHGGSAGVGATGGAGGVQSTSADSSVATGRQVSTVAGTKGGNFVAGAGGTGGKGAGTYYPDVVNDYFGGGSSGGGGGGGYAGGGGGGSLSVSYTNPAGAVSTSSGGGGGSSYAASAAVSGATVLSSTVGIGPNTNTTTSRVAGSIALTYCRPV